MGNIFNVHFSRQHACFNQSFTVIIIFNLGQLQTCHNTF